MKLQYFLVSSIMLVLLPSLDSVGQIYKWTDENGNTVFSERKPANLPSDIETVSPKFFGGRPAVEKEDFDKDGSNDSDSVDTEAQKRTEKEVAEKNRLIEEKNCKVSR